MDPSSPPRHGLVLRIPFCVVTLLAVVYKEGPDRPEEGEKVTTERLETGAVFLVPHGGIMSKVWSVKNVQTIVTEAVISLFFILPSAQKDSKCPPCVLRKRHYFHPGSSHHLNLFMPNLSAPWETHSSVAFLS